MRCAHAMAFTALMGCKGGAETEQPDVTGVGQASAGESVGDNGPRFVYPDSERGDHVDRYHGIEVADPYRWLEALDSDAVQAWVAEQNKVTFAYLETISSRAAIRKRLTALWNYERWGVPRRVGERFVAAKNDGLQAQSVLYKLDTLDGAHTVLLDPNALSQDGTVALAGTEFSRDGSKMAYGVSQSGSDWQTWRVRDVASATDSGDVIEWIKFTGVAWTRDGSGFYYARYDQPKNTNALAAVNEGQRLFFHKLGTPQSADTLIYARPEHRKWGFSPTVTEDGRYLVITVRVGTERKNSVFVQDLGRRGAPLSRKGAPPATVELRPDFTAHWDFVGNDGSTFWFRTDDGAPRGRVVAIDLRRPDKATEIIPETADTLRELRLVGGRFVASYLADAHAKVTVYDTKGKAGADVTLPGIGSVAEFHGGPSDPETFFSFSSYTTPTTVLKLDPAKSTPTVWRAPKVDFDPGDFEVTQVFVPSKDGTKVPMFIARKKGVVADRAAPPPAYLYGYGGFNIPITPRFSVPNLVWMEMGGVYVSANLRGGGEYGEGWHQAGTKLEKQNVFDDFIAAGEHLVSAGWSSPAKLAVGGRSNGGLLVGAAITQRPDLFAAALPGVGVMDMLRFDEFTIGWAWRSDYGDKNDPNQFAALLDYSPYHNLEADTEYPATMVYTADHDDRVVPAHSYKFAAALQHAHEGSAPVMIRIDTKSGHGAGKPTGKQIEEWADLWAFVADNVGMKVELPR